ncbi:MAG: hypothetical protein Q9222_001745 [Ikaeria aurantiellina]
MSKKRRREQSTIDTHLVEIYDDLANENEEIRLKAAYAFVLKFAPQNECTRDEVAEALRRLIRGLCSSRKAARLGFSVTLTEFLAQQWGNNSIDEHGQPQVLGLIESLVEQTHITGNVSGQEDRDHQLGRIFGAEALIKSRIVFQPSISAIAWPKVLDIIFDAARKKSWLREECGYILYGSVQTLRAEKHDLDFVQTLINKLCTNDLARTAEGVAIWLKIRASFPKVTLPSGQWRNENPLHHQEKSRLAKVLKESSRDGTNKTDQEFSGKGSWTPKIHFAWHVIFTELTREKSANIQEQKAKGVKFEEFWQVAVDEHLFAMTSSEERKYWGFLLFQQLFTSAPKDLLSSLFSHNFSRCLINQLASKERYLHRAAERTVKSVIDRVELEPSVAAIALSGLLLVVADEKVNFDQLTKTKTIEKIVTLADHASLYHLLPDLRAKLFRPGALDDKAVAASRQMTADLLTSIVKSRQGNDLKEDWSSVDLTNLISAVLETLATCSYSFPETAQTDAPDSPVPPLSSRTRDMLKVRLSSCLSHVISRSSSPAFFVYKIVKSIQEHEAEGMSSLILDDTGSVSRSLAKASVELEELHISTTTTKLADTTSFGAFHLLYSLTVLQVYDGDADAVGMLDDLQDCYKALKRSRQKDKGQASAVLIEVLLSFISKPSQLYRRLAQQVFSAFTADLNLDGLQSMIKVLETKENLAGQDDMFDEAAPETDAEDALSSSDSGVEEVPRAETNGPEYSLSEDEGSQTTDTSSEESNSSEEVDEEQVAFHNKLGQTLKTKPLTAGDEAPSSKESSDEDMDDAQMEALDKPLTNVLKEMQEVKNRKKQRKEAKETVVNFKCRVLELIEIFIKQRHTDLLALQVLLPLVTVIRTTTSSLVSSKACNLVRDFSRLCKGREVPRIDDEANAIKLLQAVHEEAGREGSNAHGSACSQASLLLVKTLAAQKKENLRQVVDVYAVTQKSLLLDPKCRVKSAHYATLLEQELLRISATYSATTRLFFNSHSRKYRRVPLQNLHSPVHDSQYLPAMRSYRAMATNTDGITDPTRMMLLEDSEVVTVRVGSGDNVHCWRIQEKLLTNCSPFFAAALNGSFSEAQSRSIELVEENPDAFRYFVQWLYTGKFTPSLSDDVSHDQKNPRIVIQVWALGDKLNCPAFQDGAMIELIYYYKSEFLEIDDIRLIYDVSPPASHLRQFAINQFLYLLWHCDDDWDRGNIDLWTTRVISMEEFSRDILTRLLSCDHDLRDPSEEANGYLHVLEYNRE